MIEHQFYEKFNQNKKEKSYIYAIYTFFEIKNVFV